MTGFLSRRRFAFLAANVGTERRSLIQFHRAGVGLFLRNDLALRRFLSGNLDGLIAVNPVLRRRTRERYELVLPVCFPVRFLRLRHYIL